MYKHIMQKWASIVSLSTVYFTFITLSIMVHVIYYTEIVRNI